MLKVAFFQGEDERGPNAIPLFGPADGVFEKTAAPLLLPEVSRYISTLRPRPDAQYVLLNAMGALEYWGCFPAGTLVQTRDGEVPIEQVMVGADVRTHRNRFRKVQAVRPKECDGVLADLYVQGLPQLLPALTATPNHELRVVLRDEFARARRDAVYQADTSEPVSDRRRRMLASLPFDWVSLGELRQGDLVAQPFPSEEDPQALGEEWGSPHIAFLLGLYAAEGCLAYRYDEPDKKRQDKLRNGKFERPLSKVVFVVGAHEQATIQRARTAAEAHGYALAIAPEEDTHSVRLELSWQAFAELCKDHIGSGAVNKRLSAAILRMPRGWQKELFFAYAGGGGYETKNCSGAGSRRCTSASVGLLVDLRLLLARLGMVGSISGRHNKKSTWYNGNPIFELLVGSSQLSGENSQAKSYLHPDGFILSAVRCVKEYAWTGTVYDLQVEEDCSYTASGISVHNSNINGDGFTEASLIHKPDDWTGNPLLDKPKAEDWAYGFPTFYFAHPYAHHRNKDATRAFGEVELAAWNPRMKRVELVARVDEDKCQSFGGVGVWDKLKAGDYPDVSMGCAPAGTRITVADGRVVSIERVQKGDLVLSHRGDVRAVTSIMRRPYRGTVYGFKVYGFRRTLPLTDEHPLFLVRGEQLDCVPTASSTNKGRRQRHCTPLTKSATKGCEGCGVDPSYVFEWTRADQAAVGDYLAFPVPRDVSSEVTSVDEARFLGYYLAEGFVHDYNDKPLRQITFCLNLNEREVADDIENLARRLGAQVTWQDEVPERGGRYVHVINKELASRALRFCGMYSKEKVVSKAILHLPVELQLPFLGAYLDGDGGTYRGSAYFSTSSEQLSGQIFVMLARCGIIASVNKIEHHPSERSVVRVDTTEYQVWVGTDFSTKLGPYTRKPVRESLRLRGQRFFYEHDGTTYLMSPILEIEETAYDGEVFNFSVEGDDSYVAEGLAVHNCKVPFDTCSICLDWDAYRRAQSTFSSSRDKSPGDAVLRIHKELLKKNGKGIRGVSITRKDYCEHAGKMMNRIMPDGRKVFVYNDYPKFFDISFVFIGADKTAKTMMKIAGRGRVWSLPGAELAEKLGYAEGDEELLPAFAPDGLEKAASVSTVDALKLAFLGKQAKNKDAEITKDVVPSQFVGKAVPVLTKNEKDLPRDVLDALGASPLEDALSTPSGLGMVLRPREFQRIILIQMGQRPLANKLEAENKVFPKVDDSLPVPMGPEFFSPLLARLLLPLLADRSALGPSIEKRILVVSSTPKEKHASTSSHPSGLLRKIGAAYNTYRIGVMTLAAHAQDLVASTASPSEEYLHKLAVAPIDSIFTPLSAGYLKLAFWDEVGQKQNATVERGFPSRNTGAKISGGY